MAQTGKRRRDRPLSISKFGAAKASTYDKRVIKQKQAALNAAKVNKYRKLKARLTEQASVAPQVQTPPLPLPATAPRSACRALSRRGFLQASAEAEEVQHAGSTAQPQPEQPTDAGEPQDEGTQRLPMK